MVKYKVQTVTETIHIRQEDSHITMKRGDIMAVHHGGKVGKAAKALASKSSSKKTKSSAGKTLANHKANKH